ncbi:hypothetical protein OBV_05610 [Oscillibacter valericigenes Sjm18-20]|nr:hypothetical protein OBV_05610 [Oscillibacter valericigenes Sjm18-20]
MFKVNVFLGQKNIEKRWRNSMVCCEECFSDPEIKKFIEAEGNIGVCDFCDSQNVNVRTVEDVGNFIREGLSRAYEHVEDFTGAMWDSESSRYIDKYGNQAGISVWEILVEDECIFSDNFTSEQETKLLKTLMEESGPSYSEKKDGVYDCYGDITNPCLAIKNDLFGEENLEEHFAWKTFQYACKHFNRYFDVGESPSREKLLNVLRSVLQSMQSNIKKDTCLLRARKFELKMDLDELDAYNKCAPAPIKYSVNNRMSPAGISYTYLSDNLKTCLKEIRAKDGETVLVGKFKPKKELKVLDLSINPKFHRYSIFNSKYSHDMNWIDDFLKCFKAEISKPISEEDKALEYVPTQVLAEYIRKLGYNGIKFESSIVSNTYNYALFCGPLPEETPLIEYNYLTSEHYELPYFTEWLALKELEYRKISNDSCASKLIGQRDSIADIQPVEPSKCQFILDEDFNQEIPIEDD